MKEQTYATASVFWTGFQDSVTVLLNDGGLWKRSWGNNWDDIKFTTSQDFLKYFYMTYFSVFLPHHSQMSFTPRHKSESGRSKQTGPDWRLSHIETHKPTFNDRIQPETNWGTELNQAALIPAFVFLPWWGRWCCLWSSGPPLWFCSDFRKRQMENLTEIIFQDRTVSKKLFSPSKNPSIALYTVRQVKKM